MIGGWDAQGIKNARAMKHFRLDNRRALDGLGQLGRKASIKRLLGFLAPEDLEHGDMESINDIIGNGYYELVTAGYS